MPAFQALRGENQGIQNAATADRSLPPSVSSVFGSGAPLPGVSRARFSFVFSTYVGAEFKISCVRHFGPSPALKFAKGRKIRQPTVEVL